MRVFPEDGGEVFSLTLLQQRTFPAYEAEFAPFFTVSKGERDPGLGGLRCEAGEVSPSKDDQLDT
jgi:hypothetical protein